jgi:hypothetical protein
MFRGRRWQRIECGIAEVGCWFSSRVALKFALFANEATSTKELNASAGSGVTLLAVTAPHDVGSANTPALSQDCTETTP